MSEYTVKTSRKRGQRRMNLDVPQRLLDHLSPTVAEMPYFEAKQVEKGMHDVRTLDKLFNRYYAARQAGAAERTLEDYRKHMNWLRRFMSVEYGGLDNFVPNRDDA